MPSDADQIDSKISRGWTAPKPERVPAPTYQPAVMALGITFGAFGLVTSYAFSAVGLILIAFALSRWIGELVHDE
ncbi:MAG TPA: hypothetical protein VMV27_02820 [Candidatus Binataceae bacterium]|nr:hypothetical protein [Candidatus Binataceae bacterium]